MNDIDEIWKDIEGYEGMYQVSNFGRVRGLERKVKHSSGNGYCIHNEKILKPRIYSNGYLFVSLCLYGKIKNYSIHRLVAEAFIPNINNYQDVNHKDENKKNNNLNNIEWLSHKENCNYGTRNEKRFIPVFQISLENKIIAEYPSMKEASRNTNIDQASISKCCNGKKHTKTAGGYIWKYKDKIIN